MFRSKFSFICYKIRLCIRVGVKRMRKSQLQYSILAFAAVLCISSAQAANKVAQCKTADPYRNGEATYNICNDVILESKADDKVKAEALAQRGEAYYWVAQFREAILDFDSALKISPELNETRMQRGWARIQIGDLDNAYADFAEALERDPKSGRAVFAMAFLARDEGVARRGYEQALELTPDYYLAHGNLASFDSKSPQTRENALKRYDYLLSQGEKKLNSVRFWNFGGYYQTKDYYNDTLYNRAMLLFNMERYAESLRDFRKLQALSKNEPMLYIREAETLKALKDDKGTLRAAENAIKACGENTPAHLCGIAIKISAVANLRLGKFEEVIKQKGAVENRHYEDDSRAMISLALAQAYKSLGKREEAREAFRRTGQLNPSYLGLISYPMKLLGYYDGELQGELSEPFWIGLEACLLDDKCKVNI
jgi:tetratricopeptide (TPR) repeat protein